MEKSYTNLKKLLPRIILLCIYCAKAFSQDLVSDLSNGNENLAEIPGLATERIQKISDSKKIFIITNSNASFKKGDYISIIINHNLTARALVAKDSDNLSGIKILKIYSMDSWNRLSQGREIQILRGDDSYFLNELKKSREKDTNKPAEKSFEEGDDLFSETNLVEDELEDESKKKRAIKTDNLLFAYFGYVPGKNTDGKSTYYTMFSGSWGYQIADNIWGEATVGRTLLGDYPGSGIDTVLTKYSLKLKYTISIPFYSYLQPYIGYQISRADSPYAGEGKSGDEFNKEIQLVDELQKNEAIFGISILKRLVPGWFGRLDIGTDTMSVGLGLEF